MGPGNPDQEKANQVLMDIANVINAGGTIGIIGDYLKENPSAKLKMKNMGVYCYHGEIYGVKQ